MQKSSATTAITTATMLLLVAWVPLVGQAEEHTIIEDDLELGRGDPCEGENEFGDHCIAISGYQRPGTLTRASVAENGTEPNDSSRRPDISPDGRYVAFQSEATNLIPGLEPESRQVYVHDRETGSIELVSRSVDQEPGNKGSSHPSLSADGRFVAFHSSATNLVPGPVDDDGNIIGGSHVYVLDRETDTTKRVSVSSDGELGTRPSFDDNSISADGRFVSFMSLAANLVPDDTNNVRDVFVRDLVENTTERVSVASDGTEGDDGSWRSDISGDGRFVAFDSQASNLVEDKSNNQWDVFVHDRETGTTQRVSVATDGTEGNLLSIDPAISADGRHVSFDSRANNLVPTDTNRRTMLEVFVHDRETGITERVSVTSQGQEANGESRFSDISGDGRFVTFESAASNIVPGITNCPRDDFIPQSELDAQARRLFNLPGSESCLDVYAHDRQTAATERISIGEDGTQGEAHSWYKAISSDGRFVAFSTDAHDLVPSTTNDSRDILVRDRGPLTGIASLTAQQTKSEIDVSGSATISGVELTRAEAQEAQGVEAEIIDALGADITGASITTRPEQEDLLFRTKLSSLPAPGDMDTATLTLVDLIGGGRPAIQYGFSFRLNGTDYEVRASRSTFTADAPSEEAYFALYRCADTCERIARLAGGLGTAGDEVRTAVPLHVLGVSADDRLTNVSTWTALGEEGLTTPEILDTVELADADIPLAEVEVATEPAPTTQSEVSYTTKAELHKGTFTASLPPQGGNTIWARVCLGDICGSRSVEISR